MVMDWGIVVDDSKEIIFLFGEYWVFFMGKMKFMFGYERMYNLVFLGFFMNFLL